MRTADGTLTTMMGNWESTCRVKKIMQRDRFGCGVACAAMVAGTSYDSARRIFSESGLAAKNRPFATNFSELRHCLKLLGIDSTLRRWSSWDDLDDLGIVAVSSSQNSSTRNWHWVVCERHEHFGVVLHDPDFDLPSFSSQIPDGIHSHPFTEYQARKSWIRISI